MLQIHVVSKIIQLTSMQRWMYRNLTKSTVIALNTAPNPTSTTSGSQRWPQKRTELSYFGNKTGKHIAKNHNIQRSKEGKRSFAWCKLHVPKVLHGLKLSSTRFSPSMVAIGLKLLQICNIAHFLILQDYQNLKLYSDKQAKDRIFKKEINGEGILDNLVIITSCCCHYISKCQIR